jgi:hypothetical protein
MLPHERFPDVAGVLTEKVPDFPARRVVVGRQPVKNLEEVIKIVSTNVVQLVHAVTSKRNETVDGFDHFLLGGLTPEHQEEAVADRFSKVGVVGADGSIPLGIVE